MSNDLDLRGIDQRHEPDPQFRAALQRRLASIVAGTDPGSVTEDRDLATIDLEPTGVKPAPPEHNRRRIAKVVLAAAAVVAVIAVVATRDQDPTPADQPSPTTPPRPLPDNAQGQLAPGTYYVDEVSGTPTPRIFATIGAGWVKDSGVEGWSIMKSDIGTMMIDRPVAVFLDACHPNDGNHPGPVTNLDGLVAALTEQHGWAHVTALTDISIDGHVGKAFQRTAPADMSECDTRSLSARKSRGPYPDFRSWEAPDGGPQGGFYYEPGGIETLWVLDIDGTVVVIKADLWPEPSAPADFATAVLDSIYIEQPSPTVTAPPVPPAAWSPELTAEVLERPFDCDRSSYCPNLAVSPDGTLVAYDSEADTLTWYEDEPRVVPLSVDLGYSTLIAIGPHDIAYILQLENFAAVAPSGEVIAGKVGRINRPLYPTAAGLVVSAEWPSPNRQPWMPWVDLDGNPITDTRPYPTAEPTDAGTAVRFGEREWLLPELSGSPDLRARSDGGVVVVGYTFPDMTSNLFELMPDGTIERYFVEFVSSMRPYTALPDGSLIVEHNLQLVRLTPPG